MVKKTPNTASKLGLQHILNSPANPTTPDGLKAYREMKKASGMNSHEMFQYIGRKAHMPRQVEADKKKQEERLEKLEMDK